MWLFQFFSIARIFVFFFFFNDTATTEIYTLSLHDALPISRADWHAALAALGAIDGMDLLGVPDEVLEVRRGLYERETAWAPAHVSEQLRLARITVTDAGARISRAEHEEQAAATDGARSEHARNKAIWAAMKAKACEGR